MKGSSSYKTAQRISGVGRAGATVRITDEPAETGSEGRTATGTVGRLRQERWGHRRGSAGAGSVPGHLPPLVGPGSYPVSQSSSPVLLWCQRGPPHTLCSPLKAQCLSLPQPPWSPDPSSVLPSTVGPPSSCRAVWGCQIFGASGTPSLWERHPPARTGVQGS